MPGAPAAAAPCQGRTCINRGMQGELRAGPGSHPHLVGAKSWDSDPKSESDPSAATEKLLKFRFYRMKLWNPRCPRWRSRFCWGHSWWFIQWFCLLLQHHTFFFFFFSCFQNPTKRLTEGHLGACLPPRWQQGAF